METRKITDEDQHSVVGDGGGRALPPFLSGRWRTCPARPPAEENARLGGAAARDQSEALADVLAQEVRG